MICDCGLPGLFSYLFWYHDHNYLAYGFHKVLVDQQRNAYKLIFQHYDEKHRFEDKKNQVKHE